MQQIQNEEKAKADEVAEEEKRRAHEEAEAKRKAEWEEKQREKAAAVQAEWERAIAVDGDKLLALSVKRLGDATERLTRRNMKLCVTEYVQTLCYANMQNCIDAWRKRLCRMATPEARELAEDFKMTLHETHPLESDVLVPNCIYRMGCPEFKTCGYMQNFIRWAEENSPA